MLDPVAWYDAVMWLARLYLVSAGFLMLLFQSSLQLWIKLLMETEPSHSDPQSKVFFAGLMSTSSRMLLRQDG